MQCVSATLTARASISNRHGSIADLFVDDMRMVFQKTPAATASSQLLLKEEEGKSCSCAAVRASCYTRRTAEQGGRATLLPY